MVDHAANNFRRLFFPTGQQGSGGNTAGVAAVAVVLLLIHLFSGKFRSPGVFNQHPATNVLVSHIGWVLFALQKTSGLAATRPKLLPLALMMRRGRFTSVRFGVFVIIQVQYVPFVPRLPGDELIW